MSNALSNYINILNKTGKAKKELLENTFKQENAVIKQLENVLTKEIYNKLENELKDFSENYNFSNSDSVYTNTLDGLDFNKDIENLYNELDRYPFELVENAQQEFKDNFCGQFDDSEKVYTMIEVDQAFFKDNALIINNEWNKVSNEFHGELLNELIACKSGELKSIYNLDYYENVTQWNYLELPNELKAFNSDDKKTSEKLAQLINIFELQQKQIREYITITDLIECFHKKDSFKNSLEINSENELNSIEIDRIDLSKIKNSFVKIHYKDMETNTINFICFDTRDI
jgi:hypothetical protein